MMGRLRISFPVTSLRTEKPPSTPGTPRKYVEISAAKPPRCPRWWKSFSLIHPVEDVAEDAPSLGFGGEGLAEEPVLSLSEFEALFLFEFHPFIDKLDHLVGAEFGRVGEELFAEGAVVGESFV